MKPNLICLCESGNRYYNVGGACVHQRKKGENTSKFYSRELGFRTQLRKDEEQVAWISFIGETTLKEIVSKQQNKLDDLKNNMERILS